ncbi:MAG: peptidoglycan DL-endopeptidase RipA [Microbacteriaceae bacterium]|jgi:cell wall-associated NlpC family hydrolase|nr:peptidoglycan DL-endopeptidase RipA [Microbacteriaceae bacterium]
MTASATAVGMAMSLVFAFPANAEPSTLSPASLRAIAADNGRTAAQILHVSGNVTMPAVQTDNALAEALAGIVAKDGGIDGDAAATVIANALATGGPRQTIVETALSYLGTKYVLDGASHSGIDCSGLVMVAYAQVGIPLGHLVSAQDAVARPIPESAALPGDLVVFNDNAHIGIYLGGGLLIQAPQVGVPVQIVPVWGIAHHFARILTP